MTLACPQLISLKWWKRQDYIQPKGGLDKCFWRRLNLSNELSAGKLRSKNLPVVTNLRQKFPQNKDTIVFRFFTSCFFSPLKHKCLKCLTCCDGGRRSRIHTPPLSSGCGVPGCPRGATTCPCVSHESLAAESSRAIRATYHPTRGTTPSSSSSLSAE